MTEWSSLYPTFAAVAREEGFDNITILFDAILVAEKQHERRYRGSGQRNGGYGLQEEDRSNVALPQLRVHVRQAQAPSACPACAHPQSYYELLGENW